MLAESHNWTPEQVDRMDPGFIDELFAYKQARADHEATLADLTPEQREKRQKAMITKRKIQMMKRRNSDGSR